MKAKHPTFNNQSPASNGANRRVSLDVRCWIFGIACCGSLLLASGARAQIPLSNFVFTVGTTARDASNNDWSYVLINTPASQLLTGKRFAVYSKAGFPTNAGTFVLRGTIFQQTNVAGINTLLNQSVALGEDLTALNNSLATLLHKVPGITNQSLAQKVLTGFQIAATDPSIAQTLVLLGNLHPGLHLCAGRAFSEQIAATTTYEFREVNPLTGAAADVVGRVSLIPNAPVILPAPGRPSQVATNDPLDHLLIRTRWGTPPEWRRLSMLGFGFNLWRIPRATAESAGFHVMPPTIAQLHSNPDFIRANPAPVMAIKDFSTGTGAGAADDPADRTTYFFADSGRLTGVTFTNGQEFYYFVTARDLLGRDGLVSPGGLTRACRRLPPSPPTDLHVENAVLPGTTNLPRLRVVWQQNTNSTNQVTEYWVYRWLNPTFALTNGNTPLSNRVGVASQLPGTNVNSFLDNTLGALTNPGLSNIWYTVKAVSTAACDPLLSSDAGPAWGVLRQRDAPAATTGTVVGSCGTPVVMFQNIVTNIVNGNTQELKFRFTCVRRDAGIAWVRFDVTNWVNEVQNIGPVYFPPDGNTAQIDYTDPGLVGSPPRQLRVGCTVGTFYERVSQTATCTVNEPSRVAQHEATFFAGQLLATALSSSDPLLTVLNGGSGFCIDPYSVVPDASGMVAMRFDTSLGVALIQALSNNIWIDVAVVSPDANNTYWVPYPACLVGPVPPFRGCAQNLANDPGCDQHVTRASDGGPVAPLRICFRLTSRTREYLVYRRADDGPLTLIGQGAAVYDANKPDKIIEVRDEAMPSSPTRLCYFVQLLDEHGNGSPMSFIGCKEVKPPTLPKPVLAEPKPAGDLNNPQVVLNWFCPTAGVSRFQFKINRVNPPSPGAPSGVFATQLRIFPSYNVLASYLGLVGQKSSVVSFQEAQLTSPIGPGFGPGPQFTLNPTVLPNVAYDISVAAVDGQGNAGPNSEVWRFTWTPPVVLTNVPWPARPLPPVRDFDTINSNSPALDYFPRVAAALMREGSLLDERYPVGVRIGELNRDSDQVSPTPNVGTTNFAQYTVRHGFNADPHAAVFRRLSSRATRVGETLLPIVIYRQQVTNALFPRVSGDVVQVSPLIERIPWVFFPSSDQDFVVIPDRLMAIQFENVNLNYHYTLYVRDQQPVLLGAKYRYFVLRFNARREIEEIIPAGEVQIP